MTVTFYLNVTLIMLKTILKKLPLTDQLDLVVAQGGLNRRKRVCVFNLHFEDAEWAVFNDVTVWYFVLRLTRSIWASLFIGVDDPVGGEFYEWLSSF